MHKISMLNSLCNNQLIKKLPILYSYKIKEKIIRNILIVTNKSKVININQYFWHTALLTIGKERYFRYSNENIDIDTLIKFYRKILKKKKRGYKTIQVVDQIMNLYVLLYLKYELSINEFDELIDEGIKFILEKYDGENPISYRDNKDLILVDTIGMICPFLMRYSSYTGKNDFSDIAIKQLISFVENGVDKETYFPYHSYNLSSKSNSGSSEWGRGIGWLLIGIVDSLEYIDKESKVYHLLKEYLKSFIPRLIKYQDEYGYFKSKVRDNKSHIDSSATAFIGYSIMRAIELQVISDKYIRNVEMACEAINKSMDDKGRVWDCSEDCSGINGYSMVFSCNLANGISLALLSTYYNYKRDYMIKEGVYE